VSSKDVCIFIPRTSARSPSKGELFIKVTAQVAP
jgi:hypothetical protein